MHGGGQRRSEKKKGWLNLDIFMQRDEWGAVTREERTTCCVTPLNGIYLADPDDPCVLRDGLKIPDSNPQKYKFPWSQISRISGFLNEKWAFNIKNKTQYVMGTSETGVFFIWEWHSNPKDQNSNQQYKVLKNSSFGCKMLWGERNQEISGVCVHGPVFYN